MIVVWLLIYVISIIGAILSIRYDDDLFSEKPWTLTIILCPLVNTILCFIEIFYIIGILAYKIADLELDKKIYELIRLGRKK